MTNNIDRATEIIAGETQVLGTPVNRSYDRALRAARRLADAGLLADEHHSTAELQRWLRERRIKVVHSTVARWLAKHDPKAA